MRLSRSSIIVILFLVSFLSAALPSANAMSIQVKTVPSKTVFSFLYGEKAPAELAFNNPLVENTNPRTIIQKIVLSTAEADFYKMSFRHGILIRDTNNRIYVPDTTSNNETPSASADALEVFINSSQECTVTLSSEINPGEIKDIVLIYGVPDAGLNVLDFYNGLPFGMGALAAPRNGTNQRSCVLLYLPVISARSLDHQNTFLFIDESHIAKQYLGDGVIIAPIVPLSNSNTPKDEQSLFHRFDQH
jgi:hypothetical protein